jgi:response regulator NasT
MALLDIRMPGLDGISAARTLWLEHIIPSVIISAYSDDSYLQQAQDTGVFGYLLKPASTENLRVTITIAWARALEHGLQSKRIAQLENSLVHRRLIEQAKWKLVQDLGIDEPEAHSRLQKLARNHRRRLVDVANDVLEGREVIT